MVPLGHVLASRVGLSDAKEWAVRMNQKGYSFGTIHNHIVSLKAAFRRAIQDDYVRKNPFDFQLTEILDNDTKPRKPLTMQEQKILLEFVEHDKVYQKHFNAVVILLGTGLRVSELCGLTDKDIDMEKRSIHIDHQLQYATGHGYYVNPPKTKSGFRTIPMSPDVFRAFQRVLGGRKPTKEPFAVDGYSGFLFLNSREKPLDNTRYDHIFEKLVEKYNKHHDEPLP